jgi:hypothetical protein
MSKKSIWLDQQFAPVLGVPDRVRCVHKDGEVQCEQTFRTTTGTGHRINHLHKHAACKAHMELHGWNRKRSSLTKQAATANRASLFAQIEPPSNEIDLTSDEQPSKRAKTDRSINQSNISVNQSIPQISPSNQSIVESLRNQKNAELDAAFGLAFAVCELPYLLMESPAFIAMLDTVRVTNCAYPTRKSIPIAQGKLAVSLKSKLIKFIAMQSTTSPVCILFDGWTNTNGAKITNIILVMSGVAYYWTSIINDSEANTAAWLVTRIRDILDELIENNIAISSLIADNESTNSAVYELLVLDFPWLVSIGCAAHVIQLIVNLTFVDPKLSALRAAVKSLINSFIKRKELRHALMGLQSLLILGKKPVRLLHIVPTRWSSDYYAMIRIVRVKAAIQTVLTQHADAFEPLPENFWPDLEELIKFLKPMQVATQIVQSDQSTLYDIFIQFRALLEHADSFTAASPFFSAGRALREATLLHWKRHINQEAIICCAWLSFNLDVSNEFTVAETASATAWFGRFAASYLTHQTMVNQSEADLEDQMIGLLGEFLAARAPFTFIHMDAQTRRQKLVDLAAAPRDEDAPPKYFCFDAKPIWRRYIGQIPAFVKVACAVLSIAASEAPVERSFSTQGRIHSDDRNSLKHINVVNQMFISFNHAVITNFSDPVTYHSASSAPARGAWVEIDDDVDEKTRLFIESAIPASDAGSAVIASPASQSMATPASQSAAAAAAVIAAAQLTDSQRVAVNHRFQFDLVESNEALCVEWLNSATARSAISRNNRITFNANLESNLESFMQSRNCNDQLLDLKRAVRAALRMQAEAAASNFPSSEHVSN